jgi:nitrate reductase gamma subunit
MDLLHLVLWVIYPYAIIVIVGMGLVWQYDTAKVIESNEQEFKTSRLIRKLIQLLSVLCLISGMAVIGFAKINHDPTQLFNWTISLLKFNPNIEFIKQISIISQVHLFLVLTLLFVLSFTKYISLIFNPHQLIMIQFAKKINKL